MTESLTDPELDEIETRCQAATQADPSAAVLSLDDWEALEAFRAAAPRDVPRLVAEVRRLRTLLAVRIRG